MIGKTSRAVAMKYARPTTAGFVRVHRELLPPSPRGDPSRQLPADPKLAPADLAIGHATQIRAEHFTDGVKDLVHRVDADAAEGCSSERRFPFSPAFHHLSDISSRPEQFPSYFYRMPTSDRITKFCCAANVACWHLAAEPDICFHGESWRISGRTTDIGNSALMSLQARLAIKVS
jgi:hypothetical protein